MRIDAWCWIVKYNCMSARRAIKYYVYREDEFYVAQCLNVEVSSFGETVEQATANLMEAVELFFEDAPADAYRVIEDVQVGEKLLHA